MNMITYPRLLKGLLIVVLLLAFSANGFAVVLLNGSGVGYCDGNPPPPDCGENTGISIEAAVTGTIEDQVVDGAAAYLLVYSEYLKFLNRVELSGQNGMDYGEAGKILDAVLGYAKKAKATYYGLVIKAESTPYNPAVLARLAEFDYDGFQGTHNLDRKIFKEAAGYLKNGDITGTYILTYSALKEIEVMLIPARVSITLKKLPDIENLWTINERLSGTLIFGQTIARVFNALP